MRNLQRHDHAGKQHRQRNDSKRVDAKMRHLRENMARAQRAAHLFDRSGKEQNDGADPLEHSEHERTDFLQQPHHHFLSSSSINDEA